MFLLLIAKTGIFLCQPVVWALVGIGGFCLINQKIFARTLLLVLFTMIYNTYLKSIWQVPLPAPLEGWAFPSGHMHSAFVFWGWLAVEYRKLGWSAIIFFILCLMGYGLVYEGYHYPRDVVGAVGFGSVSILIYALLQRLAFFKEKPYRLGFLLAILGLICIYLIPEAGRKPHIWQGMGALLGLSLGWMITLSHPQSLSKKTQIWQLLFSVVGAGLLYILCAQLPLSRPVVIFVQFFAIGGWIGICPAILGRYQVLQFNK